MIGPFDQAKGLGKTGFMIGGIGWYRKAFTLADLGAGDDAGDRRFELRFDGVYQNADFYLNGKHLGFHPFGYTPVAFDLTPHLNNNGVNVLAVRVDNSGENSRWYSGSGIYRHTWLTVTGPVRVAPYGVYVTTPQIGADSAKARFAVSVANLGGRESSPHVRVRVLDPEGRLVAKRADRSTPLAAGATKTHALDVAIASPRLWSLESPALYTAVVDVIVAGTIVDTVTQTFGIRSLVWNGTVGFQLNGKQVKINGACLHLDHGPMGAVGLTRSEERRIEILKEVGFNAIRPSHCPPSPELLDVCDRLGMLVWDEFTDCWDTGKNPQDYSVHFEKHWRQDLTTMILRDRNHPSVVIWSLGNEIQSDSGYDKNYATLGPKLRAAVLAVDATRPITQGGGAADWFTSNGVSDPSWAWCDVGDVHYREDTFVTNHAQFPTKPMTQSEQYPSTIYADWLMAEKNDWLVGNWVWAGWDYLGEAVLTSYPWFQLFCGDIDLIGERKPQSYWRSAVYGLSPVEMLVERPTAAVSAQAAVLWGYYDELKSWTWEVGQTLTVRVYTTGNSVELLLNGTPVGVAVPEQCVATFKVPYQPGELTAVASENGSEIGRKTLTTTGAPAAVRLTSDVHSLTTGRDDLAHVLVEIVDAHGHRVPDAVAKVDFAVNGAGELAGVANGNPHNVDSFKRPRRHTWHGQALAVLRPAKNAGTLTLTAKAHGLRPATLTLPVTGPANAAPEKLGRVRAGASRAGLGGGPAIVLGLGAAVLRRRMRRVDTDVTTQGS